MLFVLHDRRDPPSVISRHLQNCIISFKLVQNFSKNQDGVKCVKVRKKSKCGKLGVLKSSCNGNTKSRDKLVIINIEMLPDKLKEKSPSFVVFVFIFKNLSLFRDSVGTSPPSPSTRGGIGLKHLHGHSTSRMNLVKNI